MTVQKTDNYIVCRSGKNYRIDQDTLSIGLGGEPAGSIMAFYQAAAPYGWEQLPDADYAVNSIPRTYSTSTMSTPQFDASGGTLTSVMSNRAVPVPTHSHGFNDSGHNHGSTSPAHNHGVNDPKHTHTGIGGSVGTHKHTTGIGGHEAGSPDQKPWRSKKNTSNKQGVLYNAIASGGGGTLPSNKTGVSLASASGSGTSSNAKTGIAISSSADNKNNFSITYSDVILCVKK